MADSLKPDLAVGEEVPRTVQQWYINDRDHSDKWREEARVYYEFVAGRHWTDNEIAALKDKARPLITFDRTSVIVDSIHGHEIGNRREVRFIPREMGDAKANELLTAAGDWFRDESHADNEESDAFLDQLVCGMGWTETRIDFEEKPEGCPALDRVDPLEMMWDFNATKRNLADARRVWRTRRVPLSEATAMFPDRSRADLDATWTTVRSVRDLKRDVSSSSEGDNDSGDMMVTLVQVQWVERETYVIAYDPVSGEQAEFSVAEFEKANKRMKQLIGTEMEGVKARRKVRKQAFLGNVVLSVGPAPCPYQFSLQCITGKRDRNKGTWYGIVRAMMDPQRWANKWLSQTMFIMNSNAKGGLMAEKGAFANQRQAEKSWASSDEITWLEDGAIAANRVKEKPPATFPAGFQHLTEFAISSIRDSVGVSVEMLGMREAGQAASLEYQRRQAGMTILQPLFDALKHYRERQGRVMLHYIQNDLSDGRLVRIVGDGQARYVPLIKQASAEYDVIVDDAPSSPNQKEATWSFLQTLLPMVVKMLPPQALLKLLEYSPLPTSVIEELQQMSQQMQAQQQPKQQMQERMVVERHQAEMQGMQASTAKDAASAMETRVKAQAEATGNQSDLQAKREMHQMDMQAAGVDLMVQRREAEMDFQRDMEKLDVERARAAIQQSNAALRARQ